MNRGSAVNSQDANWLSEIEDAHQVSSADDVTWNQAADVVVIGVGGAGVACALQSIELGHSVIAIDRFEGGGATKASGGVIYAGGGTALQKEAGIEDTPENMFNYLKMEVGNIITDATLKDFCEKSAPTIDWMIGHGVDLRSTVWPKKTSYPAPEYFLYHSDNSLVPTYAAKAAPAARGHRGYVPIEQGRKATNLGGSLFEPLLESAKSRGLEVLTYSEARQMIVDKTGRVIGVKVYRFSSETAREKYLQYRAKAKRLMMLFPPIMPGAKFFMRKALRHLETAKTLEIERDALYIRANKGVMLSAGGFIFNRKMVDHYAPKYSRAFPLGTDGDSGAGIRLGQTAGGAAGNMDRVTAWRFINPPLSFARGPIVNMQGQRFINEMVYGATLGVEMTENQNGDAWLILDKPMVKQALFEVKGKKALNFQKMLALLNVYAGAKKAKTLDALANKIGIDAAALGAQIADYNKAAKGERDDPYGKTTDDMGEIATGPFYAINIGLGAKLFPCPTLTLGGLVVDEGTGQVKDESGKTIAGLYAGGRNAIGVASWNYISGLSIADGIYSGRRAAESMAK
ncbi:MAG: FAD-binding protein [Maricaulaceae bacterium]